MGLINAERLNTNFSRLYTLVNGNLDEANIENPCLILIGDRDYTAEGYTISGNWTHSGDIAFSGDIECSSNLTVSGTLNSIWALPAADGSANQVLKTDGSGNLGFTTFALTEACQWFEYSMSGGTCLVHALTLTDDLPGVIIHGPCDEDPGRAFLLGFSTPNYPYTSNKLAHYIEIVNEGEVDGAQSDKLIIGSTSQQGVPIDAITIHGRVATVSTPRLALLSTQMSGILALYSGAPATAAGDGVAGTITYDTNYIYICVATNTWKKVAVATW